MKQQVLTQKSRVLILSALLFIFIYGIHGMSYAGLEFTAGETATREIAENTTAGRYIGAPLKYSVSSCASISIRLHGPDANSFNYTRVFRGVQLKTKTPLDYETKNSYEVRITASSTWHTDTISVTVMVTDVNEAPRFAEASDGITRIQRSVPENTAADTNIGPPVSATDPDGSEVTLTYSLSGTNADMFEIDRDIGQLKTKLPLDYEILDYRPPAYFINVQVSDGGMSTETEVRVDVEPVNEFAPTFIEKDAATREIHEKEEVGANIGEPVLATDKDMGETLEYSLTDADTETFEIDSVTGQLRIKALLDYQAKPVHTLKVVASDGSKVGSIIVTIRVLADIVDIPDPTLARVIRRKLDLPPDADITKKAMSELTTLNHNRRNPEIRSITGLEHAINLTTLLLDYNWVHDITPLASLTKLTTLQIEGNRVDRLGALAGLTKLTSLHLSDNRIGYLVPLEGLTNLTELRLESNRVDDITSLSGLTNLRTLHLAHNYRLTDISPLADLVNLETLTLEYCPITDFSPLEGLTVDTDIDVPSGSAPMIRDNRTDFALDPAVLKTLDREALQSLLHKLSAKIDESLKYQHAIALLESILASMRPDKTELLANYPNPFNPETWIPYQLAEAADVQILIYGPHGNIVRHLDLGHQSAGDYINTSRAAYWDGKTDFGECVASGIYFYQLQADTTSPLRKMVILK